MHSTNMKEIKTAVITGNHPFEVPEFVQFMRNLEGVDFYLQDIENFSADFSSVQNNYDVLLFYNMHMTPPILPDWCNRQVSDALNELGKQKQGIFCLHHGMLAFRDMPLWNEIVGIQNRKFKPHKNELVHVEITDPLHPVTKGMQPWDMLDETYAMDSAGEGSQVLLHTDHPRSLRTLAWTRQYKNSPIFCLASGHGKDTYSNPNFKTVVERAIYWLAGKI